ncbi:MAG: flagellar biosynthetic protein FliO [Verrucomicrobiae bacterium]|nr:flagellar biosynthetic protein FliO [Verrucomicrobiae bacterium]
MVFPIQAFRCRLPARAGLVVLLAASGLAVAAEPSAAGVPGDEALPLPGLGVSMIRLMGALALVLGLFLGGVWLVRNWQRLSAGRAGRPDLKVIEMRSLGARQALWVVGYRQQRMLVASSPSGVSLLTHLPEAGQDEVVPTAPSLDFQEAFRQVLGRRA